MVSVVEVLPLRTWMGKSEITQSNKGWQTADVIEQHGLCGIGFRGPMGIAKSEKYDEERIIGTVRLILMRLHVLASLCSMS